jgi:hypothetical protein
MAEAFPEEG